jgi:hypothetical protein
MFNLILVYTRDPIPSKNRHIHFIFFSVLFSWLTNPSSMRIWDQHCYYQSLTMTHVLGWIYWEYIRGIENTFSPGSNGRHVSLTIGSPEISSLHKHQASFTMFSFRSWTNTPIPTESLCLDHEMPPTAMLLCQNGGGKEDDTLW